MQISKELEISTIGEMFDEIGEAMAALDANKEISDRRRTWFMRQYEKLQQEVSGYNLTPEQCSQQLSNIASRLQDSLDTSDASAPIRVRHQSMRMRCEELIGKMIQFGDDFREDVRSKPAMIVGVNSHSVVIDNEDLTVGHRLRIDAWRMKHRKFLHSLEQGSIRLISDADAMLLHLEEKIASTKRSIRDLREETNISELYNLLWQYADILPAPLSLDESAAIARQRIIDYLQQSIDEDLERIDELL